MPTGRGAADGAAVFSVLSGVAKAKLLHREGLSYLSASSRLRAAEASEELVEWTHRNPIFFLLLHATELALKAISAARGVAPKKTHDIVVLAKGCAKSSDRARVRSVYVKIRELRARRLKDKWSEKESEFATAALRVELESSLRKPVAMMGTFRTLGALGQSQMQKIEFGQEINDWWHAARYPRFGTTSYPDFSEAELICNTLLDLAKLQIAKAR